jgi:hypothetical protein
MFLNRYPFALMIAWLAYSPSWSQESERALSQLQHNFNGQYQLYSYPARPSSELNQPEVLAQKTYGVLLANVKSPTTMFMCLWRDLDLKNGVDSPPSEIFIACTYAPRYVENPKSFVEQAELFSTIDNANLKATWKRDGEDYRLTRFDVDINAKGDGFSYRSSEADLLTLEFPEGGMKFPDGKNGFFEFSVHGRLPCRQWDCDKHSDGFVSVSVSGAAEPMPDWMNY